MEIKLLEGHFKASEALELVTQLIHVKIKFHESKIEASSVEEDVKYRENRIRELQKDLYEFRKQAIRNAEELELHAHIEVLPVSVKA
jgi:hypothetical protein